jgi:uncharacterized protein (TIGR00725 family)
MGAAMGRLFIEVDTPLYKRIAVLGGQDLSLKAKEMAHLIGASIIKNGCCLVTGGKAGAGQVASQGAYEQCLKNNIDSRNHILCLVPEGKSPSFVIGSSINVGRGSFERRVALIKNTMGAIVIGGGIGTASEVKIGLIQAIMDGYGLIPVLGTGGEADRICSVIAGFDDPLLNSSEVSFEKAQRIVQRLQMPGNCWYFGADPVAAHDELFLSRDDTYYHKHEDYFSKHEKNELRSIRRNYF